MKKATKSPSYALLVVDMLNDFVYGKLKCSRAKKIIPKIKSLLNISREKGIHVFYCNDAHLSSDNYEFKLWGPHALKGTKGARVIDDLMPTSHDGIVPKRTYSAFYNTTLDDLLKRKFGNKGPNVLIITGIHTNICAKHTAFDAFVRGYDIMIPEDGVTAFLERDHTAALDYMKTNYGIKIIKTSQLVDLLSK
jgi:nicotinamidase-related amidase